MTAKVIPFMTRPLADPTLKRFTEADHQMALEFGFKTVAAGTVVEFDIYGGDDSVGGSVLALRLPGDGDCAWSLFVTREGSGEYTLRRRDDDEGEALIREGRALVDVLPTLVAP